MKARAPQTVIRPDYRQFRLRKLNTPEFSHIKLLLFWPVFGLAFLALERFRPHAAYHVMHCALDDAIPFSEWALIPYLLWFVYLIGALAYTFFQDVPAFRRMMRFVIVTYTAATVVYFIYPTQQLLRPEAFAHDNALTRAVAWFYTFDTNTNVCPSLHVIGLRRGAVRAAGRPAAPETGVVAGGVRASGAVHQPFHGFHEAALDPRCAVRASGVRARMAAVLRTARAARLRSQERGTRHGRQLFFADESALGG